MSKIIWIPISDYESYEVSNIGKIKNKKTDRILKSTLRNGYPSITLSKNNKKVTTNIHVIVAQAFLNKPNGEQKYVVNHINENKTDNRLCNLEYVTYAENTKYSSSSYRSKNVCEFNLLYFCEIPGYTNYMIDTTGKIYSKHTKRISINTVIPSGYCKIKLKSDNGDYHDKYVHVLIAMTYLNYIPTSRKVIVNHKDGNKQNNNLSNLEVITQKENCVHSIQIIHRRVFRKMVYYIKDNQRIDFKSAKEASDATNIDHSSIIKSCKNPTKLAGNIKWHYKSDK